VQLQATFAPRDLVTRGRNPRGCRTRGVFRRISGLWQRRRERVHKRRAISSLGKLDEHLLRDIGLNRPVLSYAFAASSQMVADTQPLEMPLHRGVIAFAPFPQRN
jgi:uncharacterized protein YjiS (DUF1127 family)